MAMDGSFSLEFAVKRFLSRCPELGKIQKLNDLVNKGDKMTEEEVINSVAELFLNPNYTIALIGCFRPLAYKIIGEAVSLLSQLNLTSNFGETVVDPKEFFSADAAYIIDYFVQSQRALILHEFACLAFCRAIDLDHSLLGSALTYFKFAPSPFELILKERILPERFKDVNRCLLTARVSFRLLCKDPELFSVRWDWSCFLELVKITLDHGPIHGSPEVISDIRWCGIQILRTALKMSDRAIENFGIGSEEAASCFLRWKEFCKDVDIEKAGLYVESSEQSLLGSVNGGIHFSQQNFLLPCDHNSLAFLHHCKHEPMIKSRRLVTWNDIAGGNSFVMTSTMKKSFEMVLLAVSQRWPILLYGPAGSGKTALISKLAQDSGIQVLTIHMDEQFDGKALIGTYVCAEQPGEFRWQPGSLIQAVLNGYWVVFEDIDKAPSDVQSILLPLLEGASFFITSHGEEIRVPESFRLFSTISTSKIDGFYNAEGGNLLSILWRRVMIGLPNTDDLQNIVKAWYPNLEPLAGKLIETVEQVNLGCLRHIWGFQSRSSSLGGCQERFSIRDLLKWCKRIAGLGFSLTGDVLTAYQCRCIYQEALDIFAAFSASTETRLIIMKEIAKVWAIPPSETGVPHPYNPEIQDLLAELRIGRVTVQRTEIALHGLEKIVKMRSSLQLLERISCSVKYNEPVLLVGETGTGKTTLVQNLATILGQKITILNLSQQSDVADLLGGFKPLDPRSICVLIYKEFESLFSKIFSVKENEKLFGYLQKQLTKKNWTMLLTALKKCVDKFQKKLLVERSELGKKRKKPLDEEEMLKAWNKFSVKLETAIRQTGASHGMIFSFVEGAFVTALRNGEWILLDEVNLAPPETLQRIIGVLEGDYGSLCLAERGDISHIPRHSSFRIFGCMNPATDAGKRDLPYSLRSRFTEYFVDDVLDKEDLKLFINKFMEETRSDNELEQRIINFYQMAKVKSEERLQDGANQKPQYSLRSLYRALEYTREAKGKFKLQKALYDGFCMFFLTMLDKPSAKVMKAMIKTKLLKGIKPEPKSFAAYLKVGTSDGFLKNYVITKSVKKQLENLARAIFIKRYPVLLQGPTSSGKTSLVQYLAAITGNEFVRINNHEHTDLQEYLGTYISDTHGKLIFQEGVLVKAVRKGYWIVLDELNLAPSDVLEALNRLLDDNRELFVPELRETIRAHPNFMLFATQNPPIFYGGRKILSRAFRNRFVEVHVDEIPDNELSEIIEKRCEIPASRAKIMVEIMKELQLHRQRSKVFAGKHGFITPRDLFRWANRLKIFGDSKEVMAEHGYYLLADRLRDEGEKVVVQEVLEKHLRVRIVKNNLYKDPTERDFKSVERESEILGNIILTKSMRRLYFLVKRCYELREPVLLVGETGGGKTTVCQLLSRALGLKLHILNCHQYSETSDFIGGFYPIRERSRLTSEYNYAIEKLMLSRAYVLFPELMEISSDIAQASSTLDHLAAIINSYKQSQVSGSDVTMEDLDALEAIKLNLLQLYQKWKTIFTWQDGPLVQAMKAGDLFLVDEISLADDSVLERLNSVLEPERRLSLAEKGGSIMEDITAHENFLVLATMNPGGDYGKKELSPALRNRFTEIWVPPVGDLDELRDIASNRFSSPQFSYMVDYMMNFWEWFNQLQAGRTLTVRDLLSWVEFIYVTKENLGPDYAFFHGLFLVLLDGLSLGTSISKKEAGILRENCLSFLLKQLELNGNVPSKISTIENYGWGDHGTTTEISCTDDMLCDNVFGISPFYVEKGYGICESRGFEFLAPTTRRNALRVLRAMQLSKPVLLEGSPGVGKTSLVIALGKYSGHKVVRINLSEQTDLMDLLGSDLPVDSDEGMKFEWSDGILLQALKDGSWVLLDELNLAPQSVLEGLNAILDHRAEVFIPEIGITFKCPPSFRVFACQNPLSQGGGRKGLPRSFLNRFTKVYIDELVENDYLFISSSLYPSIPRPMLSRLILFNKRLHEDIMIYRKFAQDGSPWEFNLRDVIRSCEIIQGAPETFKVDSFIDVLYVQRMRTPADRKEILRLYEEVFGVKLLINPYPRVQLNTKYLTVGNTAVRRNIVRLSNHNSTQLNIIPSIRHSLEAVTHCLQHQWLCILVGPPSSGKTSLIRLLAEVTGNVLNELNLSSATDISELLGCFEQYDAYRNFRAIYAHVERYVAEYCSSLLEFSRVTFCERENIISKWLAFTSKMDFSFLSTLSLLENCQRFVSSLNFMVEILEQVKLDVVDNGLPVSWSINELSGAINKILELQDYLHKRQFSAKFEWVAGVLIKAIENGEWVILENANLCNPTVLDRINSLVEASGTITINECGTVNGSPVVLHPHPNFRMFLTVNPRYGEVSRAMRNRGVEIFMMPPYWLFEEGKSAEFELKDVKRFIELSGVPVTRLVEVMANAHVYARNEAIRLNVHITYLELGRWIKLFQQLLINGNQPFWSLQKSWEHTYISALGEGVGWDIISYAKTAFLSVTPQSYFNLPDELSLNLPIFLEFKDLIFYSKESSVKQNCMYLDYLISQCEIKSSSDKAGWQQVFSSTSYEGAYFNLKMIEQLMFPKAANRLLSSTCTDADYDLKLVKKMIQFTANWAIEQATEIDFKLYFLWFSWLSVKLGPGHFFCSFEKRLQEEFGHSIWKCIFHSHHELVSHHQIDLNFRPIPLLSLELVDLTPTSDMLKTSHELFNAINCIGLLRLSYEQWNAQIAHIYSTETQRFKLIFESLQGLEKEILDMLVTSPSYDVLLTLCTRLLDDHIIFWKAFISSEFEHLFFSWHSLVKDVSKLQDFCPRAVEDVLMLGKKHLDKEFYQGSQRSLLWIHGGHPILPPSANLYHKQNQLLELCDSIWQPHEKPYMQVGDCLTKGVASYVPELRFLAVQGICLSSHIISKCDVDHDTAVQQLEEMQQMLSERFEYDKRNLEAKLQSSEHLTVDGNSASCCVFFPEVLYAKSGFVCWQEALPIVDSASFFLDMELLQKLLTLVLIDPKELEMALGGVSNLMKFALKYSLTLSGRPPQNFIPHQKLLWTLEEWASIDSVNAKISSYVLEMWFWWHLSLWNHCPISVEGCLKVGDSDIPVPAMLAHPVKTASVIRIMRSSCCIKDYSAYLLKLKLASHNFWESPSTQNDLPKFLLPVARSLFQQIVHAHKRVYDADKFAAINSIFCCFQKNRITLDELQNLSLLITSSSDQILNSMMYPLVEPLLRDLYLNCSSTNFYLNTGHAWLRIGELRFSLLLGCHDIDPALKYSFKHSQIEERISLLELEIKVRQECDYLAGWSSSRKADKKRIEALQMLEIERKRLQKKMVFRSNSSKFNALRNDCKEFLKRITVVMKLVNNTEVAEIPDVLVQVCDWQKTATCFIEQLSNDYKEYIDVVQPVQVAVYEMKLGLSLMLSGVMWEKNSNKVGVYSMEQVTETIGSLMRFPRGYALKSNSSNDIHSPLSFLEQEANFLEKLVSLSSDHDAERGASILKLKISLHLNILVRVSHFVADSKRIDRTAFKLLDKLFSEFARLWMNMKIQVKSKEGCDAQEYKFRPRAFEIKHVIDVDISTFGKFLSDENSSEWLELLSADECLEKVEADRENENLEEEWNLMEEAFMNDMIQIHNQLFGSINLVSFPGTFCVSDADRLRSFINSYSLGAGIIRGLGGPICSSLDAELVPEHMLRLCLEHEKISVSSHNASSSYNFYKDSNASEMSKMVKLLVTLQQRSASLLNEWEDHPGLQKVIDAIEVLLAIPMSTPLGKALLGLRLLLNRARVLGETGVKFSPSDQLEPIIALVRSWQKMEYDSWPALLNEVQDQYELNAAKLWFPLFSVLHNSHATEVHGHEQSTIESLEDFINTSSIGEFRKRLQLLFAFLGQMTAGSRLKGENGTSFGQDKNMGSFSSEERYMQILYNIFGYYVQFLPRILENIGAYRRDIEMELKEHLKLCHWERVEVCLAAENSKKNRQKLRKLIQKYTDVLQQPVMLILNQEAVQKGIAIKSLQGPSPLNDTLGTNVGLLNVVLDHYCKRDRLSWFCDWRGKVSDTLQKLYVDRTSELCSIGKEDVENIMQQCGTVNSACLSQLEWSYAAIQQTLEKIGRATIDCDYLWKDMERSVRKKLVFTELLKLLESSGLQKHKFEIMNLSNSSNWLLVQPSYDAEHLLLTSSRLSHKASVASEFPCQPDENTDTDWKTVNEFYFKSTASVQLLQRVCLKPHQDITHEQASRSLSFLNHLIEIQQSQRAAAYDFAERLKCLRECLSALKNLYLMCAAGDNKTGSLCSISPNQSTIFRCMWKQKQLFDSLVAMLVEESLLLKTVGDGHSKSCQDIKLVTNHVLQFIENFIPLMREAKVSLDDYLVSGVGVMQTLKQEASDKDILGCVETLSAGHMRPYVISRQMEELVYKNFQVLKQFEEDLVDFQKQDFKRGSVVEKLLHCFDDVFEKGKLLAEELEFSLKGNSLNESTNILNKSNCCHETTFELDAVFDEAFKNTFGVIMNVLKKQCLLSSESSLSEDFLENITSWEFVFKSSVENLHVEELYDSLLKMMCSAGKIITCSEFDASPLAFQIGARFEYLHALSYLILTFGDDVLQDLLAQHKTVSVMTHVLANVLASFFSKGFGISAKEEGDDAGHDKPQDATGTGMGEGSGVNDVSEQITDEDQLLGTSDKPNDEQDASGEAPSKEDKGIEMEQDFTADTYSVSQNSEEENDEDSDDGQLESAMGETGPDGEAIDEKLWDKEEDETPNSKNEGLESGPSAMDTDTSSRELRAKEDSAVAEELGDVNAAKPDKQHEEAGNQDDIGDGEESMDDMHMDKEESVADPTGLQLDELKEKSEDINEDDAIDGNSESDSIEEVDPQDDMDFTENGKNDDSTEKENVDEPAEDENVDKPAENGEDAKEDGNPVDDIMDAADAEQADGPSETNDPGEDSKEKVEMNTMASRQDVFGHGFPDVVNNHVSNTVSATLPNGDSQVSDSRNIAPEEKMSNTSEAYNDIASMKSLPFGSMPEMDLKVYDQSSDGKFTDQPKPKMPEMEPSSVQKSRPNPYRNVGDALEEWKERVKVTVDLQADNTEATGELEDRDADEYGYVPESELGTAQALGPATSEQVDPNISNKSKDDNSAALRDDITEMEIDKQVSEEWHQKIHGSVVTNRTEEQMQIPDPENPYKKGSPESNGHDDGSPGILSQSLVSVRKAVLNEDLYQLSKLSVDDNQLGSIQDSGECSNDINQDATAIWRKYEFLTKRLSQELAEQLRLVLEPTRASKLQGDYKSGKRINMKRVIAYIASQFRKDKIWLRRTQPNKRDYQVVIAVDDSRSMSESCCGDVAIESLVTVCSAMSQLEMGSLAVASFGKKGNIRLLHDFDQPFNGEESGVKIISSLTFSQENTIADEPVADLLTYLKNMLDAAVMNARLPSGQNPLQQLVLIIADGRFHEKEKLKHCVRDFLSQKRMVAFLLLDSPQESIMDQMEASFVGEGDKKTLKFAKYLDSFPFPYYIVLRNIQELPRTLADLLRQWFELMQYTRE
ncbi:midasin isoform X2 [Mercurialis annua]|uniref:midasin isoform X2 n=1 Tax=Mercurialis annua TaxID=3986 RepID=UPI00215E314D|nr:midasin isoform X2 [Mercurialis annua]